MEPYHFKLLFCEKGEHDAKFFELEIEYLLFAIRTHWSSEQWHDLFTLKVDQL